MSHEDHPKMQPLGDLEAFELEKAIERSQGRTLDVEDSFWRGLPSSEMDTAMLILGYHKRHVALREEVRRLQSFLTAFPPKRRGQ